MSYSDVKIPTKAWDLVNTGEFTQLRQHGYGQTFLDNAVRSALSPVRGQVRHARSEARTGLAHAGMEFSGLGGRVDADMMSSLVQTAFQAEGQARQESEQARTQAHGQYLQSALSQDQMTLSRDMAHAQAEEQRRRNKGGFWSTLTKIGSLVSMVPGIGSVAGGIVGGVGGIVGGAVSGTQGSRYGTAV